MDDLGTPAPSPYAPSPATARPARNLPADLWWLVAAAGVGILALARVVAYFDSGNQTGAAFLAMLGSVAVVVGMALAAALGKALPWGVRAALLIAAAYFSSGFGISLANLLRGF